MIKTPLLLLTLTFVLLPSRFIVAAEQGQPNFVFILTDDQRNDTLACAGHPIVKTPNVADLAKNGGPLVPIEERPGTVYGRRREKKQK